jgi:hypothetical protein
METRAILIAWIVGLAVAIAVLQLVPAGRGTGTYAGIEPGARVPLHDALPQAPRAAHEEPLFARPGDR